MLGTLYAYVVLYVYLRVVLDECNDLFTSERVAEPLISTGVKRLTASGHLKITEIILHWELLEFMSY